MVCSLPRGWFLFGGLLISSAIPVLARHSHISVDNVLTKIRNIFALGIEEQVNFGYRLADGVKMAIDTKSDINRLPETEGKDNQ